jgi:uncharacterized membrane protein
MASKSKENTMINQTRKYILLLIVASALVLAACGGGTAPAASNVNATQGPAGANVSFAKDIMPLLQSRCVNCHGGQQTSRGLNMTSYDSLMAGSQNGPILTAGDATNSLIVQFVTAGRMPKGGPRLTPSEVQLLTDWINAGAKNN